MKRKFLWMGLSFLLVASLVLASCAEEEEEEVEEPITIQFINGPVDSQPAVILANGALAAAEILGPRVDLTIRYAGWTPEAMLAAFQEAVAMKPDGIMVMGHPGVEAFTPFIEEAEALGIIVTSVNTPLPELETKFKGDGFGYVGSDLYMWGYGTAEAVVETAGLVEGDRVFVWGLMAQPTRGMLERGAVDAYEEAGMVVDYLEITPEINLDPALGVPVGAAHLIANPDTKVIMTVHGSLTATLEDYITAAGLGPDDIFGAGFDIGPATTRSMLKGYIDLVGDQQLYLQGFLPVFQVYLTYHYDFAGFWTNTGSGLIDASNIEALAPLAEVGIR